MKLKFYRNKNETHFRFIDAINSRRGVSYALFGRRMYSTRCRVIPPLQPFTRALVFSKSKVVTQKPRYFFFLSFIEPRLLHLENALMICAFCVCIYFELDLWNTIVTLLRMGDNIKYCLPTHVSLLSKEYLYPLHFFYSSSNESRSLSLHRYKLRHKLKSNNSVYSIPIK